jgi:hypothetical protein
MNAYHVKNTIFYMMMTLCIFEHGKSVTPANVAASGLKRDTGCTQQISATALAIELMVRNC